MLPSESRRHRHLVRDDPDPVYKISTVIPDQYPGVFETMLNQVRGGTPMRAALADDPRRINIGDFMEWVMRNPERKARYYEAQEIAAEVVATELIPIADGQDTIEDVARSALRVNTRRDLMKVWGRKRFGDPRHTEIGTVKTLSELTFEELVQKIANLDRMRAELPPPPEELPVVAVQEKAPGDV
jgi:hypothetical protein